MLQILERRIVRSTVSLSLPARGWLPAPTVHVYSPSREMLGDHLASHQSSGPPVDAQ